MSRYTDTAQEDRPDALVPIGEAARRLGVAVSTVRRWDETGHIASVRTVGGQRRYRESEIARVLAAASSS